MGFFVARPRRILTDGPEARRELPEHVRTALPARFEAVGEALASGPGSTEAWEVAGRALAQDGASLEEVLNGLSEATRRVARREPTYAEVRAVSVAWSEATLAYLHQLSCEDPLTGLASLAHVRSRLTELYRAAAGRPHGLQDSHSLVVVDLPLDRAGVHHDSDVFSRTLRVVRLGEAARTVFPAAQAVGRLDSNRVVVLTEKDAQLGRRVGILRSMLSIGEQTIRVWIEGLPPTDAGAAFLLDELARA